MGRHLFKLRETMKKVVAVRNAKSVTSSTFYQLLFTAALRSLIRRI